MNFTSLLSGDPHTDNLTPVQGDKGFIQDIHDVEITNAKAVVKAKDKNEDETDLKKRYQTASVLSVEENSKSLRVYLKTAGWSWPFFLTY